MHACGPQRAWAAIPAVREAAAREIPTLEETAAGGRLRLGGRRAVRELFSPFAELRECCAAEFQSDAIELSASPFTARKSGNFAGYQSPPGPCAPFPEGPAAAGRALAGEAGVPEKKGEDFATLELSVRFLERGADEVRGGGCIVRGAEWRAGQGSPQGR